MVSVGFAKQDLEKALRPDDPVREERVEAVSFYAAEEHRECVWVVLDFMDFDLRTVSTLADAVSEKTGIEREHVHIVTTHNHGGGMPDVGVLSELSAECAVSARKSARPALMRFVRTECDKQVTFTRRKYVPELEGMITLFFGASEEEGFNAAPFIENAVKSVMNETVSYSGRQETHRPFDPFAPGDNTVFAAEFRGVDDTPLGSFVRFAAHAVCCNRPGSFSSDYPYHIRTVMEKELGGISLFFNGPCADIAPGMKDKFDGTEKVLGEYIGNTALKALKQVPFHPLEHFSDLSRTVPLAVREGVKRHAADTGTPLPEDLPSRLRALERIRYADQLDFLYEKYSAGEASPDGFIRVSIGILRLDGFTLAAFPGETFSATGRALCEAFPEESICTVTEHGRTAMYIPPKGQCELGGYETTCRTTKSGEEEVLRSTMIREMAGFLADR